MTLEDSIFLHDTSCNDTVQSKLAQNDSNRLEVSVSAEQLHITK